MNNLFNNKKFGIQAAPAVVRKERIRDPAKPPPLASKIASTQAKVAQAARARDSPARNSPSSARSSPATPSSDRNDSSSLRPNKRKASRQKSPAQPQRLESDSSDDEEDTPELDSSSKRQKAENNIDTNRQLRSKEAFSEADNGKFKMIHAADIASGAKKRKTAEGEAENVTVELKYPSTSQRERYELVFGKDKINPLEEIINIATIVTEVYLAPDEAKSFTDPNMGIIRKLEKARNLLSRDVLNNELLEGFKGAVDRYSSALEKLVKDGAVGKRLDSIHSLPFKMVTCILQQVYDRAVSPQVDLVRKYKPASDNIYGELLPPFVSRILQEAGLKSDHVFVDLGSGVGSVVLQAALEFGSESWGCEMMENAYTLAEAQENEFKARCRLWGIKTGAVRLEKGDFLENKDIQSAMRKADVILVNNQAFGMKLNRNLIDLFLDLKDGCRIISLVNFVDRKLSSRTIDDPANLLDVKKGEYHSNSVSWTDAGGNYYIATKDQKRLAAFSR